MMQLLNDLLANLLSLKIKESSYTETYITLPANKNENSLIFTSDYSPFEVNAKLTNAIIKILTKNGYSCEFEYNDKLDTNYLFIKWFNPFQ